MSAYLYIAEYRDRFGGVCPTHKKIGIGANVPARMRSLSDTKGTIDVVSLFVWKTRSGETIQKIEHMLHKRFAKVRLNGEWFADMEGSLLAEVKELLAKNEAVEPVNIKSTPITLPPEIGDRKGHFDYVAKPKGRRRDISDEEIIGQLQAAYKYLVERLSEEYVALNDNGPYIRANCNEAPFWIEPRKTGIKLNFWAGEYTELHSRQNLLLTLSYDGEASVKIGTGKHEGLRQFNLNQLSIADLSKVVDELLSI